MVHILSAYEVFHSHSQQTHLTYIIARLGTAYPNVVPSESAVDEETTGDETTNTNGLDGLSDAEMYRLVVG